MNQVQKKSLRKKLFKPALHLLSEIAVNSMYNIHIHRFPPFHLVENSWLHRFRSQGSYLGLEVGMHNIAEGEDLLRSTLDDDIVRALWHTASVIWP